MSSCPVCLGQATRGIFRLEAVPVREGYLAPRREEAVNCDLGYIDLWFCDSCGHIWNASFDPDKLTFDPQYNVSMFHSPEYRRYVDAAIDRLVSRHGLQGAVALEIACGKGDFMRALVAHGFSHVHGFDPTFDESTLGAEERERITAHRAYYDEAHAAIETSLVACRSALQYFREPRPFVQSIARTLASQPRTVVYFEVPSAEETFSRQVVWNIAYEHGCFFSPGSLSMLFRSCGFRVLDILPGLNGSQLELEAMPGSAPPPHPFESRERLEELRASVDAFASVRAARIREWQDRLSRAAAAGQRVVLWGAGARAISMLGSLADTSAISAVADINPARQGRFMPRSGLPVISPDILKSMSPDLVVATNPNFAGEIRASLHALGIDCAFAVLH